MAEDHVCSCGISFDSILDPPDDATLHTPTDAGGPSGLHNDWVSAKTVRRRIELESCLENDWAPNNIVTAEASNLQNYFRPPIKRSLDSDLMIGSPSPRGGDKSLGVQSQDSSTFDRTLPHSNPDFDVVDGCFTDVGFKIVKAATVVLLQHLINDKQKDECEGCAIDHPSQLQHSCLFDPPNYYFDTHFDELSGKLFKPSFHSIITTLLERCGLKSQPHRIQGTVGTILRELKDEPFIVSKVEEIRARLLDKPCKEIVGDVVDLWENLPNANGQ